MLRVCLAVVEFSSFVVFGLLSFYAPSALLGAVALVFALFSLWAAVCTVEAMLPEPTDELGALEEEPEVPQVRLTPMPDKATFPPSEDPVPAKAALSYFPLGTAAPLRSPPIIPSRWNNWVCLECSYEVAGCYTTCPKCNGRYDSPTVKDSPL